MRCETLYLVGDIIDFWSLKRRFYWPATHMEVVRAILDRAREGTRVVFVPGNHDYQFRTLASSIFGGIEIHREIVHTAADGRRMLVMHGDEFDGIVHCHPAIMRLGVWIYDFATDINPAINAVRRMFGLPGYSLAATLAKATPRARRYLQNFQEAAAFTARRRGMDGIVCGHIHHAAQIDMDGVLYCNTGDWVGSCTALTESREGKLSLRMTQDETLPLKTNSAVRPARAA